MQSLFCVNGPKLHILRFRDGYCDAQLVRMGAEPPLLRSVGWQIQCTHLLAHSIRLVLRFINSVTYIEGDSCQHARVLLSGEDTPCRDGALL